jgi:hypothetical protein
VLAAEHAVGVSDELLGDSLVESLVALGTSPKEIRVTFTALATTARDRQGKPARGRADRYSTQ